MKAYWFSREGVAQYGTNVPFVVRSEPYTVEGPVIPCQNGLHASEHPYDALTFAHGTTLDLVELGGEIIGHGATRKNDKYAASERTHLKRIDATPLLREFARWCALQVVDNWPCPPVVRQFLETGDESLMGQAELLCTGYGSESNVVYYASKAAEIAALCPSFSAQKGLAQDISALRAAYRALQEARASTAYKEGYKEGSQFSYASAAEGAEVALRVKFQEMIDKAFEEA